jgi:hypothetical protein
MHNIRRRDRLGGLISEYQLSHEVLRVLGTHTPRSLCRVTGTVASACRRSESRGVVGFEVIYGVA